MTFQNRPPGSRPKMCPPLSTHHMAVGKGGGTFSAEIPGADFERSYLGKFLEFFEKKYATIIYGKLFCAFTHFLDLFAHTLGGKPRQKKKLFIFVRFWPKKVPTLSVPENFCGAQKCLKRVLRISTLPQLNFEPGPTRFRSIFEKLG